MIKKETLLLVFISLFLTNCASTLSSSYLKDGYVDTKYKKVAVIGISDNLTSRVVFEKEAVELLKEKGINAVKGINMFPQKMTEEQQTAENFIKIIKDNKLDGVLTMSLIDTKDGHRYQPGKSIIIPSGYFRVGKHIYRRYVTINEPDYYEDTKSYVIEAVLYNLKGELKEGQDTWVWTGESSLVNPSSLNSSAVTFCKRMVNQIVKDGVILSE